MPMLIPAFLAVAGGASLFSGVAKFALKAVGLTGGDGKKSDAAERPLRSPTPPRTRGYGVRRLFGRQMLYDTNGDGSTVDVWAYHDGRVNSCLKVYLNEDEVTISGGTVNGLADGAYGDGKVLAGYNLGATPNTAFAAVVSALPGIWTSNHRGDGIVGGYLIKKPVKAENFIKRYPQGDDVTLSLALELQPVFDPRAPGQDPDDPATWAFSTNAVLHTMHFFMTERGEDYATVFEPVIEYWTAAADDADEAQALSAGGTEPRYRGCVLYDTDAEPSGVITELLSCFDGWTCLDENGCRIVYSGRIYEPTVSIGPDAIVSWSLQQHVAEEDGVNEIVVQYISADHKYSTVEAQAWRDEADILLSGKTRSDTFSPQVPSHTQARRLAKRLMLRRNAPSRGTCTTTFSGRAVIGQRYVNLRIAEAGAEFLDAVVEITGLELDYETGGVAFDWVLVADNMDDWNPAVEDGAGATEGVRVPPADLDPPAISSATYFGDDNSGSGTPGARARVIASGPDRDDLTWFLRWRSASGTVWNTATYPDLDPGTSVTIETAFLPTDTVVEVEVAYMVGDGRLSPWSTAVEVATGTVTFDSDAITFDSDSITWDRS